MSMLTSISNFMGLQSPPLQPGFTLCDRGVRLPVCEECGALVAFETQRPHSVWHGNQRTRG